MLFAGRRIEGMGSPKASGVVVSVRSTDEGHGIVARNRTGW